MFDWSIFTRTRWTDIYVFLISGSPPPIVSILFVNTLFFMYFLAKKVSHRGSRSYTVNYVLQALLISANFLVIFQHQMTPALMRSTPLQYSRQIYDVMIKGFFG